MSLVWCWLVGLESRPKPESPGPPEFALLRHQAVSGPKARQAKQSMVRILVVDCDRFNDPSAGSPTETLLRLLLPLGGRVQ
jgi:hypothetical protein